MSRYVLDTTVLIECEAGIEPTASRIMTLLVATEDLCVCAITLTEFYSGSPRGTNQRMDALLDNLTYLDLTPEMAATAGRYRYEARAQGRRLATPDTLIAALARHSEAILLTNNVRDFPMPDIRIERLSGDST